MLLLLLLVLGAFGAATGGDAEGVQWGWGCTEGGLEELGEGALAGLGGRRWEEGDREEYEKALIAECELPIPARGGGGAGICSHEYTISRLCSKKCKLSVAIVEGRTNEG